MKLLALISSTKLAEVALPGQSLRCPSEAPEIVNLFSVTGVCVDSLEVEMPLVFIRAAIFLYALDDWSGK